MNTFYSIAFIQLRAFINEKVSIGLLLSDGNKIHFDYSKEKLKSLKGIVDSKYESATYTLKNIKNEIDKLSIRPADDIRHMLYSKNSINENLKYSTNLIYFYRPERIDLDVNIENYNKLFKKFVYFNNKEQSVNYFQNEVQNYKNMVKNSVNIDFNNYSLIDTNFDEVTSIFPSNVDSIGRNDRYMIGQAINFESRFDRVRDNYHTLNSLVESLNKNTTCFVIGNEPPKDQINSHNIWKLIFENKLFDLTPIGEIDKIKEYIKEHEVKPILDKN